MSRGPRAFSPIVEFEHSAYNRYLPTTKRRAAFWIFGIVITVLASRIAFGDRNEPEAIYLLGACLSWIAFIMPPGIRAIQSAHQPFQEWWLTFPLDRRTLIRAKLLAALRFNSYFAAAMWLIATIHNSGAAMLTESPFHASTARLWADAAAYALLYAAIVLFVTCFAALVPMMMNGWFRLLLLPFIVVWSFPMGNLGKLMNNDYLLPARWQQSDMAVLYAIGLALLGWGVYHAAINGVAKYGMKALTPRTSDNIGINSRRNPSLAQRAVRKRSAAIGFRSLIQLERSKHRSIASNKWMRLIRGILAIGLAIGGYAALQDNEWVDMVRVILIFPSMITVTLVSLLYLNDMSKRRIEWIFSFPYSPFKIALSRLIALWTTTLLWVGGALLAAGIGAGIRYFVQRPDIIATMKDIEGAGYLLLAFLTYFLFGTLVIHAQYGSMRNPLLAALGLPFAMVSYLVPTMINTYVLPVSFGDNGVASHWWIGLGITAVIAIPFALYIFVIAARNMANSLLNSQARVPGRTLFK
ncbi:hypothetical protein PCCS19_31170 [Paenibacillus sp. CCS19]|uniref:hypothetical protein n=1 Tax=Paenibacillus sp. CCS19 TaxID=3158387 RepID=UPI0025652469|nr:hypothetical protein [Paenibacillus cellulosilyticus]GMK40062.1 hypothetical protein PCCS19_31170 [Paenibacillus cellulosilyticus]